MLKCGLNTVYCS